MTESSGSAPDHLRIDKLVESLLPGHEDRIGALFNAAGLRAPVVIWSPDALDIANPLLARFDREFRHRAGPGGRVAAADLRPCDLPGLADWLLLLDVETDGETFRYTHYGDGVAEAFGASMVGRTTTEFDTTISKFFTALYRAARLRAERVLSEHEPPPDVFVHRWSRLIEPLWDGDRIVRFGVANLPDTDLRAGLEIIPEPVLIVDDAQTVRYANRPAREIFGHHDLRSREIALFDYAGLDVAFPAPALELASRRAIHDVTAFRVHDSLLDDFRMTISGAMLRGHAFYVIMLRPRSF